MISFDDFRHILGHLIAYPLDDTGAAIKNVKWDCVDLDKLALDWSERGYQAAVSPVGPDNHGICAVVINTQDADIIGKVRKYFLTGSAIIKGGLIYLLFKSDGCNERAIYKFACPAGLGSISVFYENRYIPLPPSPMTEWENLDESIMQKGIDSLPRLPIAWVKNLGRLINSPTVSQVNVEMAKHEQFKEPPKERAALVNKQAVELLSRGGKPDINRVAEELLNYDANHWPNNSFFLDASEAHNQTTSKTVNVLNYINSIMRSLHGAGKQMIEVITDKPTGDIRFRPLVPFVDEVKVSDGGEFEIDLVPEIWRDMVKEISEAHGMAAQGLFMAMLAGLGACLQGSTRIQPIVSEPFFKRTNLAVGMVASSGSKKSDVINLAIKEILKINKELKEINSKELLLLHETTRGNIEALKASRKKDKAKQKEINKQILDLEKELEENPLQGTKFLYENAPIQKMIVDLKDNQRTGLLVIKDEMKQIFAEFKKKGNEDARSFYMKGIDGNNTFSYATIGRGEDYIDKHVLSLLTAVQPDVLKGYIKMLSMAVGENDGFLQRITLVPFGTPTAMRPEVIDFKNYDEQYRIFRRAFWEQERTVNISSEAVGHYNDCRFVIRSRAMKYHHLPVGSFLAKQEGMLCQLAYLYAYLKSNTAPSSIRSSDLDDAMKLLEYLSRAAKEVFEIDDKERDNHNMRVIAEMMRVKQFESGKSQAQMFTKVKGMFRFPQQFYALLKELELRGYVAYEHSRKGDRVFINPEVYLL